MTKTPNDLTHPCPKPCDSNTNNLKMVMLESPFAGDVEGNTLYARQCMRDSIKRGEVPFASHLLYTQEGILDDNNPEERLLGMKAGMEIAKRCDLTAVYIDKGISRGMMYGIESAYNVGREISFRSLKVKIKEIDLRYSSLEELKWIINEIF